MNHQMIHKIVEKLNLLPHSRNVFFYLITMTGKPLDTTTCKNALEQLKLFATLK